MEGLELQEWMQIPLYDGKGEWKGKAWPSACQVSRQMALEACLCVSGSPLSLWTGSSQIFLFPFHFLTIYLCFHSRNLYLHLSLLLLLLCNLMGGYRFSSCFIISFLYGQKLTRHIMHTLACGTFMGSLPWIHGSGVPYITVGRLYHNWYIFSDELSVASALTKIWYLLQWHNLDRKAIFFIICCLFGVFSHFGNTADFKFKRRSF